MPCIKTLDNTELIELANQTRDCNQLKVKVETRFAEIKTGLIGAIRPIWDALQRKDIAPEVVTNFKLGTTALGEDQVEIVDGGIIQVQMKLTSKAWEPTDTLIEELSTGLGEHFGKLFEEVKVVASVRDAQLFFKQVSAINGVEGMVKFTSTGFSVSKKAMAALTDEAVVFGTRVSHKSGFLDKLSKIPDSVVKENRMLLDAFINSVLSPVVVCGNRSEEAAEGE